MTTWSCNEEKTYNIRDVQLKMYRLSELIEKNSRCPNSKWQLDHVTKEQAKELRSCSAAALFFELLDVGLEHEDDVPGRSLERTDNGDGGALEGA